MTRVLLTWCQTLGRTEIGCSSAWHFLNLGFIFWHSSHFSMNSLMSLFIFFQWKRLVIFCSILSLLRCPPVNYKSIKHSIGVHLSIDCNKGLAMMSFLINWCYSTILSGMSQMTSKLGASLSSMAPTIPYKDQVTVSMDTRESLTPPQSSPTLGCLPVDTYQWIPIDEHLWLPICEILTIHNILSLTLHQRTHFH